MSVLKLQTPELSSTAQNRLKIFKYYTEIKMKGKKVERRIQNKDYNQVDLWSLLKLGLFWQRGCLTWKKTEKKINSKLDLK